MNKPTDIHLARTGLVTHCNYQRLGYQRLARGVYGHVEPITGLDKWQSQQASFITHVHAVMAAYAGKPVVLYGPTALQVLGMALPTPLQDWDNCHLLIPAASRRPERSKVIAHRTHSLPAIWRMVDGLPVLHPVDHLLQVGNATIDQLVEVGDGLMRRRKPLLTFDQVIQRISELDGASGVKRVRRAAKWFTPGTDSLPESSIRLVMVHAGLPIPTVNGRIWCPLVGRAYHGDLVLDEVKIVIEYDGAVHVSNHQQMEIDAIRRRDLQDAGWLVITITASQLRNPAKIVQTIETAIIARRTALRTAW